jgi:hypothetical protein
MRCTGQRLGDMQKPFLHVYRGPETDKAGNKNDFDPLDPEPSSGRAPDVVETFWAGRTFAARFSSRVAA